MKGILENELGIMSKELQAMKYEWKIMENERLIKGQLNERHLKIIEGTFK
jgi:hypothetical protein